MGGLRAPIALPAVSDVPLSDSDGLLDAPVHLPDAERAAWVALAPHAIRERTLIPSRVPGFTQLCRQWVYCQELDARIRHLGITSAEADRLLRHFDKWEKALSASLGNFSIRSFGKPAAPEKPRASTNAFAGFGKAR
ncbi:MAG TPA: hypothetical protein VF491_17580 [Vicinamibacterales bacterium]